MSAIFNVDHTVAKSVSASASDPAQVVNLSGGTLYYKNAADVDSGDSSLANGASVTVTAPNWIVGVSGAPVKVLVLRNEDRGDVPVVGDFQLQTTPSAYTVTNHTADKALDCNAAAVAETNDVLGSLINDLIEVGILQGTVSA